MAAVPTSSGFESGMSLAAQLATWEPGRSASNDATHHCRYWPCDLLAAFMLQMACKGQCVNESMMLGSREYAMEKLNLAHTLNDETLRALAVQMFAYFDDEPCHAVATFVAAAQHH